MRGHDSEAPAWGARQGAIVGLLVCLGCALPTDAPAYGFYQYGNGRTDYQARYDLVGEMWPTQAGSPLVYDFGDIAGFAALPPGLTNSVVSTAAKNAGNLWEPWANVSFGDALSTAGTGLVRLTYDATMATGAATWGYNNPHGGATNAYAEIVFGKEAQAGTAWNADNFEWVLSHEMGHVLGLDDLYLTYTEEFVDHPVAGNALPDRTPSSREDNIMDRYRFDGNDYSKTPQTIVDNDEIAGLAWLWESPYNQVVTGDLEASWTSAGRQTEAHHGDQVNPSTLGWWDYRGSVKSGGNAKPYVDVEFPGYETFAATTYSAATVTYAGNQGGDIERFIIDEAGWEGNFELYLKSSYTEERRVRAWVSGGGRTDSFVLPIDTRGRVFDGASAWPVVFGPMGDLQRDFGDLPDTYLTLLASNGPRYEEGDLQHLGRRWDAEPDGQPTSLANGDDVNLWGVGGPDDEDGVIFGYNWVDVIIEIARPGLNSYLLRAWWDLDWSGFFDHPTELFIDDLLTLDVGSYVFRYNLGFDPRAYNSRFRLTYDPIDWDVLPYGEYVSVDGTSHGEVEDYAATPAPPTPLLILAGLAILGLRWRRSGGS